ncbi:hypothetical protein KC726_05480 [Candidatus Woesebacteria bacterium]|nr:hypothetical protein [Candidatus Woesebacteria bacterium]
MKGRSIKQSFIRYLLSLGIYGFSFFLITFLEVLLDFSFGDIIVIMVSLLLPSFFIAKRFGMRYVLIPVIALLTAQLLLWLFAVTHGHFFENIRGWLSETNHVMDYLPWQVDTLLTNLGVALIGGVAGISYKKIKRK